jgi:transcriptional/translational regulatory protein YebC/TACO1
MAEAGSVAWQFTRKGYVALKEGQTYDEDELFMLAADGGADDVQFGDVPEIYAEIENFQAVQKALEDAGLEIEEANLVYEPNNAIGLDVNQSKSVMSLIDRLEDLDDVQNVYSALDISDELIAMMEEGD